MWFCIVLISRQDWLENVVEKQAANFYFKYLSETNLSHYTLLAYMWSDTISSGPTDIGPPNTSYARQTETPDIYEFRFFAIAKS